MELRKKAPWVVIAAATAIFGTVNYISYRSQVGFIERFREHGLREIAIDVSSSVTGLARGAATYGEIVASLPETRSSLAEGDRAGLVRELAGSYRIARSKYAAQQATFFGLDLKTFCRLMRPDMFGDDVSHRDMIVLANKQRKAQSGLETSVSSVSARAVVPVSGPDGKHVGTFEWGFNLSRTFVRLKENSLADTVLLVDENTFTAPVTSSGIAAKVAAAQTAEADRILDGYRTVESTNVELMKQIVKADHTSTKDVLIRMQMVQDTQYGVIAIPISDFEGQRVGSIVVAKSMAESQRAIRATKLTFLAATVAGLILLAGVVQIVFNGFLIRPIVEIGENADAIVKDPGQKLDLKSRTDEIGSMARNLDVIRDRLAKEKEAHDRAEKVSAHVAKMEALDRDKV